MIHSFTQWLNEQVQYNKELNQKIWTGWEMDPAILEKLMAIAKDFWNFLDLDAKIIDIQLTGSIANYNWAPESDLDVHIIVDFSQIDKNVELVRKALDGQRFIWNQRHPVVLRGHDVECYIQEEKEQHVASGLFSLLKNEWIAQPTWNPPSIDPNDVSEKVRVITYEFYKIKEEIQSATGEEAKLLHEYLHRFKKKIMKDRKSGLERGGEFSIENLVFKELKRKGVIEDIIDTETQAYVNIYNESTQYLLEKKKPNGAPDWHDSDAPDAKGRFRKLGIRALASWLIRTRGRNMQKINGSLTQQIVFNRNRDPAYAKKMEKVREEVKRQLGK
jgi:hypothetical protein